MQPWHRINGRTAQPTEPTGVNPELPVPLYSLNAALGNHAGFYDAVSDRLQQFLSANTTRVNCGAGVGFFPTNNATATSFSRKSIDLDLASITTHLLIWIEAYGSVASGTTTGWNWQVYEGGTNRIRVFINSTGLGVTAFGTAVEGLNGSQLGLNSIVVRGDDADAGYDIWVNGTHTNIRGAAFGSLAASTAESFIRSSGSTGATAYVMQAASWDADHYNTFGQSLSINPWLLWEPERIWVPVASAGGAAFNPAWARNSNVMLGAGVN